MRLLLLLLILIIALVYYTPKASAHPPYKGPMSYTVHVPAQNYDRYLCNRLSPGQLFVKANKPIVWRNNMPCFDLTDLVPFTARVHTVVLRPSRRVYNQICLYREGMLRDNCAMIRL